MGPNTQQTLSSFILFFNKCSQSTYYVLGILLGTRDIEMSKGPVLLEFRSQQMGDLLC